MHRAYDISHMDKHYQDDIQRNFKNKNLPQRYRRWERLCEIEFWNRLANKNVKK